MVNRSESWAFILLLFTFIYFETTKAFQFSCSPTTRAPHHRLFNNDQHMQCSLTSEVVSHYRKIKDVPLKLRLQKTSSPSLAQRVPTTALLAEAAVTDGETNGENVSNKNKKKVPFPIVIWRFTRPHTLIGSALAIPALHILAAPTFQQAFQLKTATSALYAMVPSLLMNLYITGLNQITDVEIDKVNKPNLPIAAGDLSVPTASIVVVISLIVSLLLGIAHPVLGTQGLNIALWGSMILGTMYSLQPFRLKRFPLLAAFCIVAVRGTIINAGFYAHAKAAAFSSAVAGAGGSSIAVMDCVLEQRCVFSSLFFAIFGVVIGKNEYICPLKKVT